LLDELTSLSFEPRKKIMRNENIPKTLGFIAGAPLPSIRDYFELHAKVCGELPYQVIEEIGNDLFRAYEDGRSVFIFGNGGSASLASHLACDLGKGTVTSWNSQKRFRVNSITDNIALLTAWANDTSYEHVFAEPLRNFLQPRDIALGISASGNSPNVLLGLQAARQIGAYNIGLSGFEGGKMKALCDRCAVVPSDNMQIIEDLHVGIAHALFTIVRHRICTSAAELVHAVGR
jgi:D-sedoheptulose 7-phosphate isomerase